MLNTPQEAIAQFRDAIQAAGLIPPDVIEADGKLRRFASNGKRRDDAGWYLLHGDGIPAGSFGDWRTGQVQTWRADIGRAFTPAEESEHRARAEAARQLREAEEARRHAEARERAGLILAEAHQGGEHPYVTKKGIQPHGAKLIQAEQARAIAPNLSPELSGLLLVVPMRADGVLHSLQFIAADGIKRPLTGGRVAGCYHAIGNPKGAAALCVCEGFATGASIHEATGYPVAVAFSANNLETVALALRAKFPDLPLILCADDDVATPGNPGLTRAKDAARVVGGVVAIPDFGTDRPDGATDCNDLAQLCGLEAVGRCIANAAASHQQAERNAPASESDGDGWPELQPLPDGLPPVAAFDLALLPDTLKPWAADICERVQCAPDFVAAAIMAGLGSIIGRKLGIRPQARTDWTVTPNQWALVVGRPGVLKSPALEAALSPIKRLAATATEAHQAEAKDYARAVKVAKLRAEEGEKAARKMLARAPDTDVSDYLNGEEPEAPTARRYIAVDSNAASLGELHRQNPNGLLVHRDEMVSLLKGLDREDQAEARGFYLTGWNGDSSYTFDRIGRGLNLHIPAVCLSMLGSTQPGRIAEYIRHAVKGGAGDDGLIQRFGLLVWPDTGGDWRNVDRWPDGEAKRAAFHVYETLDRLDVEAIGAQRDTDQEGEPDGLPYLRFDAGGLGLFLEWRTDLETRLRGGDLHPAMESHLAKYRKLVPALALVLHLAGGGTGPVSERATLQALAWAEYLETHARRAYASVTTPEVGAAKAIIARIRKGDLPRAFASWQVWRQGWAMLSDRVQVADALGLLVELGWLAASRSDTGGRPGTVYDTNPRGLV